MKAAYYKCRLCGINFRDRSQEQLLSAASGMGFHVLHRLAPTIMHNCGGENDEEGLADLIGVRSFVVEQSMEQTK